MDRVSLLFFLISVTECYGMLPSQEFFKNESEKRRIVKKNELLQGYFHYRTIELPEREFNKSTQIMMSNNCIAVITGDNKIYIWDIESGNALNSSEKISHEFTLPIIHCFADDEKGVKSPSGVYLAKIKQEGRKENPLDLTDNIFVEWDQKLVIRIKRSFESLSLDQIKVLNKKLLIKGYPTMKFTKTEKAIIKTIPTEACKKIDKKRLSQRK